MKNRPPSSVPSPERRSPRRRRMSIALASFLAIASLLAISVASASAAPPTAVTETPTITKVFGTTYKVTMKGTVNPNGIATTYWFEWGTTPFYGGKSAEVSAGSGSSPVSVSALLPPSSQENEIIYFRVVAKNKDGMTIGADRRVKVELTPSWSLQTTPNPNMFTNELKDVSCPAGGECFAVGRGEGSVAMIQRWNGTEWKTQSPPLFVSGIFESISCTSISACTAVGSQTVAGSKVPLAARWDGTSWKVQAVTAGPLLQAVSCASATECVAIGSTGGSMRWDGIEWKILSAGPAAERDVSCTSASFCMAVSDSGATYTWNGSVWTSQKTPTGSKFLGVSCTASNACTAVGRKIVSSITNPFAARWNGSEWSAQEVPSPGAIHTSLTGVSCPSATVCYATGISGTSTFAERWNGSFWEIQSIPNVVGATSNMLFGVSCSTVTTCETVGYSKNSEGKISTLAERAS